MYKHTYKHTYKQFARLRGKTVASLSLSLALPVEVAALPIFRVSVADREAAREPPALRCSDVIVARPHEAKMRSIARSTNRRVAIAVSLQSCENCRVVAR